MSIKPLSYQGFSLDFLVAGSNREKEGKGPGDITACVATDGHHVPAKVTLFSPSLTSGSARFRTEFSSLHYIDLPAGKKKERKTEKPIKPDPSMAKYGPFVAADLVPVGKRSGNLSTLKTLELALQVGVSRPRRFSCQGRLYKRF